MERRLAAVLAADVVGYARLVRAEEARTLATLRSLRAEVVDPAIATHHGRTVKLMGDGMLAEFPSAVDAVRAAVEIQTSMAQRAAGVPDDARITFRIGINLGDVVIDGDDIHGDGVNVAARLEGLSPPGGICISGAIYDLVRDRIDANFRDLGMRKVKNIDRPVPVWQWTPATERGRPAGASLPLPDKPSIAVLPFENMSGDAEQEFFADGMTEDIITELSRFENLFVIARNTSFTYKKKRLDAKSIAQELGVHFILEGSVRKAGQRVRITGQLIDGHDGNHIWAERYDGAVEDVFELQEQVTSQVVGSISPQVTRAGLARIGRGERLFDDAHERAWRAQHMLRAGLRQGDPATLDQAIGIAVDAAESNPACSIAYQTICYAFSLKSLFRWGENPMTSAQRAEEWARKFVAYLPESYMAYHCLGLARFRQGRYADANRDFERAHALNPNDSVVLRFWAFCEASAGAFDAAKRHAHMAIRLSPKDTQIDVAYLALAMAAFIEGDAVGFEEWAGKAIQLDPNAPLRRAMMVAYAANIGNQPLLETHRAELMRTAPDFVGSIFRGENPVFQQPEHVAVLVDGLRRAGFSD